MNRTQYLKIKDQDILQIIWHNCPKCQQSAEAIISGKITRTNKWIKGTVKALGWNCHHCNFKQKVDIKKFLGDRNNHKQKTLQI